MFNKVKIASLYGVVGLRQPYNPTYQVLDADNQISRSGYYATENKFVKIEYLKENQDYAEISDADFNEELKHIQESAISSVCNDVFNESDYIDRQVLYPHAQNRVNVETMKNGLICYKLQVSIEKNVAFEINRVMLDFQGTGTFKLMLFNTSQTEPIESKDITITTTHQVEELNWVVDNSDNTYKGDYYLGYLTGDDFITGDLTPFKRDYERSDIMSNITHLNVTKRLFTGHSTETIPDLTTEQSTDVCLGINPDITVFDDYTDLILRNEKLFSYAILLDFQVKLISTYLTSLRSNKDQRNSNAQATQMMLELEGQSGDGVVKITGLKPLLRGEISRIKKEIDKLKRGYFGGEIEVITMM